MIVLLQNYKYNCPCFCIANKQIDTVFHGEAGRMIAHDLSLIHISEPTRP